MPGSLPTVCPFPDTDRIGAVVGARQLGSQCRWADQWNIVATAAVSNPTGPGAAPVTRTVKAVVPVIKPIVTPIGQNNPLNFIYGNAVNFPQSVTVASPVFAVNDLRLGNSSTISAWIGNVAGHPNKVAVGGNFYEEQNANKAGHVNGGASPANDLGEMYVHGQCSTKSNNQTLHSCAWGAADQIWATIHGSTIPSNFLDFVPKLTCCSPYSYHASLAPFETARSSIGEAYRTADLGPCTLHDRLAAGLGLPRGLDTASAPTWI